jgi:hypothetical protein
MGNHTDNNAWYVSSGLKGEIESGTPIATSTLSSSDGRELEALDYILLNGLREE